MKRKNNIIGYIIVAFFTVCFIYIGRIYALQNQLEHNCLDKEVEMDTGIVARVEEVLNEEQSGTINFTAVVCKGELKGTSIQATQAMGNSGLFTPPKVETGDRVVLYPIQEDNKVEWLFEDYSRIDTIIFMAGIFLLAVVIICGVKGFTTLVSLGVTFAYIMAVLVPMYTAGINGHVITMIVSAGIVFSSLLIIHGINTKSIAAVVGCWTGLAISAFLAYWASGKMKLTGYTGDDSSQLFQMYNGELDMKAIVFTITVLSSLGATMDVAMSISSALHEVKRNSRGLLSRIEYFKSGMEIGKDTIGTMSNTLILAYMGGNLTSIMIYCSMNYPLSVLLNKQELIVEFAQSLIGVFSILVTIPITAICCAFMFYRSYPEPRRFK
ncbi:MAG: YibE/F family protein [Clostridia bacterium]|nr:YibE/F family protein [Clostridia bacterium]